MLRKQEEVGSRAQVEGLASRRAGWKFMGKAEHEPHAERVGEPESCHWQSSNDDILRFLPVLGTVLLPTVSAEFLHNCGGHL